MIHYSFKVATKVLLTLLISSYWMGLSAQEEQSAELTIYFRSSKVLIDPTYRGNGQTLDNLSQIINAENDQLVESVSIHGFASPEGLASSNYAQAMKRAEALSLYFTANYPFVPKSKISTSGGGVNWNGLRSLVATDPNLPNREQVLRIIDEPLEGDRIAQSEVRSRELKALGASTWSYLLDKHFSKLRTSTITVVMGRPQTEPPQEGKAAEPTTATAAAITASSLFENELRTIETQLESLSSTIAALEQSEVDKTSQNRLWEINSHMMRINNQIKMTQREARESATSSAVLEVLSQQESQLHSLRVRQELLNDKFSKMPLEKPNVEQIETVVAEDILVSTPTIENAESEVEKRPLFAIKTNLLYNAATILNAEIEVPIGNRWSVAAELMFPWWVWNNRQHALQLFAGTIEGRYWFGDRTEKPLLTGWFGGLYASAGYYDFEWNRKGYQGEFLLNTGVSGGYAHPISKDKNWRMEYALGVGFVQTKYRHYEATFSNVDNQWHLYKQYSGRYSWFGPTRLKVSLVWMLNYKAQKGYSK